MHDQLAAGPRRCPHCHYWHHPASVCLDAAFVTADGAERRRARRDGTIRSHRRPQQRLADAAVVLFVLAILVSAVAAGIYTWRQR